jgi:hypothetical protein
LKSLGDEGSTAGVMPSGSFMNISKESDSVFRRYASLEDPCGAALVKFSLDYCEGF